VEEFKHLDKMFKTKKAQSGGLITGLVFGIASLVIGVIVAFVIVSTMTGAGLLEANSTEFNTSRELSANFTAGVDNVSEKIPTILLIAAIVLILGVLVLLVGAWQNMRMGGGGI